LCARARGSPSTGAAAAAIEAETGQRVLAVTGDVTVRADCERMLAEAAGALGGLDILVTNSGGPRAARFDELDDGDWQAAVDLLLLNPVRMVRAALPYLRRSPAAAVLAVASYTVKEPQPNLILSNSIRLAVVGLMKSLALELGQDGIRFNCVLPGFIETERIVELLTDRARRKGTRLDDEVQQQAALSPFGRMGRPEEFANVAAFLCSPAAAYVTGAMLGVDGGMYKGTL
jgi:3-oxoacyl-[acyl-carrier protein] reductase